MLKGGTLAVTLKVQELESATATVDLEELDNES